MKKNTIVIGLGQTGLSCVRFLLQQNEPVYLVDSRENPPMKSIFTKDYPDVPLYCGVLPALDKLKPFNLVLSPGLAKTHPFIQPIIEQADDVLGDIDLFALNNTAPVIAITGSNGKSTVTKMVGEMAAASGFKPAVVGNIGVPVLSILGDNKSPFDIVVLELSSFQLELINHLSPQVATVLNISPDHLDRYPSYDAYIQAKHRIFERCEMALLNKDDPLANPKVLPSHAHFFSAGKPDNNQYGILTENGEKFLGKGQQKIVAQSQLPLVGQHNLLNALAAYALGSLAGFKHEAMIEALKKYQGLAHRCQVVSKQSGKTWVNDSKGTNVGATVSAIKGLKQRDNQIVLILGGQPKDQDFSELVPITNTSCRHIILLGEAKEHLYALFQENSRVTKVEDVHQAVKLAASKSQRGDVVLFSPACASFDQFDNFEHRGDTFIAAVQNLGLTESEA